MRFFYRDDYHLKMLNELLAQPLLFLDELQRHYAKQINHGRSYSMGFAKMQKTAERGL